LGLGFWVLGCGVGVTILGTFGFEHFEGNHADSVFGLGYYHGAQYRVRFYLVFLFLFFTLFLFFM
jgi:hypothetical protein